ncbi:MAG TPA: BsuBI/PstI family type II restriction endonuclease [Planctomycetaceae bacterium]|nr:BsuBI/PstI family type II restriction endonuclease [Planctomycetaceae bacterium]
MSKRDDALQILKSLGLPKQQQNERSSLTLLALAGLKEVDLWKNVKRPLLRIWDIMSWMRDHYEKDYAANSRETIRRQTIHQFEQARLVDRNPDDPSRPTNSGDTVYQLTEEAAEVLKRFGERDFAKSCAAFIQNHGSLTESYERCRNMVKVPVILPDGSTVELSAGIHNELQRSIIEEFAPRFAPGSFVLYLGDTADKILVIDSERLANLNIPVMSHDKLPDVVLYDRDRNWIFMIEAVTSHGPVSAKRHSELESLLGTCSAGRVYVTAFPDFATFKKYASEIVWESEVWISESHDHMIHFNGDRFLGPYPQRTQDAEDQ